MIVIKLRAALEAYRERTGRRLTYSELAERVGLARTTIESIASRPRYNASLETIDRLCQGLECEPSELLEWDRSPQDGRPD